METPEQPLTPDLVHVVYTRDALGMTRIYLPTLPRKNRIAGHDDPC